MSKLLALFQDDFCAVPSDFNNCDGEFITLTANCLGQLKTKSTPDFLICPLNSSISNTSIDPSAYFTGQFIDVSRFKYANISCNSQFTGTLYIDLSMDGITMDSTVSYSTSSTTISQAVTIYMQYFRLRWQNNDISNTSTFRLQTIYRST